MPGFTNTYAIEYPCLGDIIDPGAFLRNGSSTEAALATAFANADLATQPPAVEALNTTVGDSVLTGVTTALSFTSVLYDRGGFWPGVPSTILTIPSNGSYFLASTSSANVTGNVTSIRWAFLRNGVEVSYWENQNTGVFTPVAELSPAVMIPACVAGDQITFNVLYTGTQPNLSFFGRVNITRLAIP
jgi:hypothetical protein